MRFYSTTKVAKNTKHNRNSSCAWRRHLTAPETIFQIDPPFAVLTFNRPEARNAMTWAMYDAPVEACESLDADPQVRVLILRGAGGKAFGSATYVSQFRTF